ncbi:MAG: ABC transporter substrate-binding protein [Butyribacter sp.]|nr:ABC transporter substrate-binding protein [bacterium]MDY3854843.1 ABC transporter substrate-binding protein [Butyribacter sp.]
MKKRLLLVAALAMVSTCIFGCGASDSQKGNSDKTYKVGIVQYVDDASLNQIQDAIQTELDGKGKELGVTFDYEDYTFNGQADQSTLNQIMADLVADEVDIIIPIATPTAVVAQAATEENQIPVVFAAVSDPEAAGLVKSMDAPGANITGVSDALNTEAILKLIVAADSDVKKLGLLYDKSQDSSKNPVKEAKEFCEKNGIEVVEKTGTTNDEISLAADALAAANVDAVFTPTDNTVMTAELAIYEKFTKAKIPHYCGADSFALNGAFCGYGVNYEELGTQTAQMAIEVLTENKKPGEMAVKTLDNGIATVNTETAEAIGLEYSAFKDLCEELKETKTAKEFE